MQRSELAGNGPAGEATGQADERTAQDASGEPGRNDEPGEDTVVTEPTDQEPNPPRTPGGSEGEAGVQSSSSSSDRPFKPSPRPRSAAAAATGTEAPAAATGSEAAAEAPANQAPEAPEAPTEDTSTEDTLTEQAPTGETATGEAGTLEAESPAGGSPVIGRPGFRPSPRPRSAPTESSVDAPPAQAPAGAPGHPASEEPPNDELAGEEFTSDEPAQTPAEGLAQPATEAPSTGQPPTGEPGQAGDAAPVAVSPGWEHLAEDVDPVGGADGADGVQGKDPDPPVGKRWGRRIGVAVATIALMLFIPAFIARMYGIPSESMETTLHGCAGCDNDRVLVDRTVYRFRDPHPGEVVVFNAGPEIWGNSEEQDPGESNPLVRGLQSLGERVGIAPPSGPDFVKRVIAVGGQTVSCCDSRNRILVDDTPVDEPYVYFSLTAGPAKQASFPKITIPAGMMWMMGDNRNASLDSRAPGNGPVPVTALAGKVRAIIYPFSRIGSVDDTNPQQPR